MAASDPFLVRAVAQIRGFAQDSIDQVRWPNPRLVELIDAANALVHGELLSCLEPKTHFRFAEASIAVSSSSEDYAWPANVRRFTRLVWKDSNGQIRRELPLTDYLSDLAGVIILDDLRGFRISPKPTNSEVETWTLVYEAGVTPQLCYGAVESATAAGAVLAAPSSSQLGSLSLASDFYVNSYLKIVSGNGAGQVRRCTAWNGTTRAATVAPAWSTQPDATSIYEWLPCVGYPLDQAIAWRVCMDLKSADGDYRHRETARSSYKELMREILMRIADRQGRTGPSLGSDYMCLFDYGMS